MNCNGWFIAINCSCEPAGDGRGLQVWRFVSIGWIYGLECGRIVNLRADQVILCPYCGYRVVFKLPTKQRSVVEWRCNV